MELYQLHQLVSNGFVYAEVHCGLYGLPQAAIIANQQVQEKLEPHSYHPVPVVAPKSCILSIESRMYESTRS
jgi:hypothetical protein